MPKILYKENEQPEFKGERIDLNAWLTATEEVKDKEGNVTGTKLVNITPTVAEELKDATEIKDDNGRVIGVQSANLVAQILSANTKVEDKPYTAEYVGLSAKTVDGALILMDGVADTGLMETDKDGKDTDVEKPSVAKYFNQGYGILARNAAAARIRTLVEGPDKALMAAAKDLARAKGWSVEKAFAKVKAMAAED